MRCSEEWHSLGEYGGLYEVSNHGSVRSVSRTVTFTDNKPDRLIKGRVLKAQVNRYGYSCVRVSYAGKKHTIRIHREVALAFILNRDGKPQVNHIDGDKGNNHYKNLEWCTNSENQLHAVKNNLRQVRSGRDSPRFKGSVLVFDSGGVLRYTLSGNKEMADNGFDFRLVHRCLSGKSKTHRGYTFKRIKRGDV